MVHRIRKSPDNPHRDYYIWRAGNGGIRAQQLALESPKLLATFLHLLHGTPYVYQGEEIGMTNVAFPSIEDYRDIEALNMYRELVASEAWNRRR